MSHPNMTCAICARDLSPGETRLFSTLPSAARAAILADHPHLPPDASICLTDMARCRRQHLERLLERERGSLTRLDQDVLDSLQSGLPLVTEPDAAWNGDRTIGEKAADAMARFAGSWTFIIGFCVVLGLWMGLNVTGAIIGVFDPYPFILLNLVLSSIAALQAPVIMMSQRRQEAKDRLRSENDYKVNLKAELEIRHLHDKIDHHLMRQWEQLAAIQRLQIELLEEATRRERN
jgi:uncharacterized membrane protein